MAFAAPNVMVDVTNSDAATTEIDALMAK